MDERERIGRYEVISRISQGGMGAVYLAQDPQLHRRVAIKLLLETLDTDDWRKRFHREARALARLVHPNIVTIFDFGEDASGRPFIVMEYVEGRHLGELAQESLTLIDKLGFLVSLCEGLDCAHTAGITHLDVKPANLIVETNRHLKIVDFGIARLRDSRATVPEIRAGTPSYMAPELFTGGDVGPRTDQFAAGIVAYELLSGRRAFEGTMREIVTKICAVDPPPLSQICPGIDPALDVLVMRALSKDPSGRFATMAAMGKALVRVRERLDSHNLPTIPAAVPGANSGDADTILARGREMPATVGADRTAGRVPVSFGADAGRAVEQRWTPPPVLWTALMVAATMLALLLLLQPSNDPPDARAAPSSAAPSSAGADVAPQTQSMSERVGPPEKGGGGRAPAVRAALPREIETAVQQFADGTREVLSAVESALRRYPNHPELVSLLTRIEDRAQMAVDRRKLAAANGGAAGTADYERGVAAEREAADLRRQGQATAAVRKYWEAEDLYLAAAENARDLAAGAPAAEADTQAPASRRDEDGVRAALQALARGYERMSAAAVKAAYPNLTLEEVRALDRNFLEYSAYQLDIRDVRIAVKGTRATANCLLESIVTLRNGTERRTSTRATFTLESGGGAWQVISASRLP
jgi:tRNA A-37 threonylcarbamoyl transferase component Bud32